MNISAFLGSAGLSAVGYQFYTSAEATIGSRITAGIADAANGWYSVDAVVPSDAASVRWNDTVDTSCVAREYFTTLNTFLATRIGSAQAGGATSITLDAGANATNGFYANQILSIISGTGAGQSRIIETYTGATKVATVPAWAVNPDNTSFFSIYAFGAVPGATAPTAAQVADQVWDETRSDHNLAGSFGQGAASVQGNVTGSVGSVTGAVGSVTGAVGSVTAPVTAGTVNDKTGYSLSVAGIAAIWDAALTTLGAAGSIGKKLKDWVLGTDSKAVISADVHTSGATVAAVTGNVGGNVVGSVASVTGNVSGNVVGSIGSLAAQAKLDVNAEADTALADYDAPTHAELTARSIDSADYATSTMLTAVKAKTDVQIDPFRINTATDGSLNSITLDAGASTVLDFYKGCFVILTSGTGVGQCRAAGSYSGGLTKIITVSTDWAVAPAAGTGYAVIPFTNVLSGTTWQTLLTLISGGGGSVASVQGYSGEDQSRTYTQIPAKLNMEGVVGNNLYMDVLFESTDITGYAFSGYVVLEPSPLQKTYPLSITVTTLKPNGLIRVSLTAADTSLIGPVTKKPWVLIWDGPGGEHRSLTAGLFQLNRS